ncbi:MAG: hypothetical protein WC242_03965 [Candidatus Paceibacterota bacterium]|jgi:hypothetical protein
MIWVILLVFGVGLFIGYLLRGRRLPRKTEKVDILKGSKEVIDERIGKIFKKKPMSRDEKWFTVAALSALEALVVFVILPALSGSMVRAQGAGDPGSLSWFFPWLWQGFWWLVFVIVAILLFVGIRKMVRYKVPCSAEEGEDKKGGV